MAMVSWQFAALLSLGGSTVLVFLDVPVALAFVAINIAARIAIAAAWPVADDHARRGAVRGQVWPHLSGGGALRDHEPDLAWIYPADAADCHVAAEPTDWISPLGNVNHGRTPCRSTVAA
jgi:hypothetical protein